MKIEPMAIEGAWVCSPTVHADARGVFLEWFRADTLATMTGTNFQVAQANHSVSTRGVVRGVHFSDVPPGQAKLVYCPSGSVLDVVVDLRVGSPTFGLSDSVVLDDVDRRAAFISEGLGHAFYAQTDQASLTYLVSSVYDPQHEHTISPADPALGLPWPTDRGELVMSDRDAAAPTLAEAEAIGLLPTYHDPAASG
jgi:dTDP-4-dehydrorhamnose 3,5-epimerase